MRASASSATAKAALGAITAAERDEMRAIAGLGEGGTLRVGAFLSAANSFVPTAVARFEAAPRRSSPGRASGGAGGAAPPCARATSISQSCFACGSRRTPDSGSATKASTSASRRRPLPRGAPTEAPARPPPRAPGRRPVDRAFHRSAERRVRSYRTLLDRLCAGRLPGGCGPRGGRHGRPGLRRWGARRRPAPELAFSPPHDDVAVRPVRDIQPFRSLYATWLRSGRVPSVAQWFATWRTPRRLQATRLQARRDCFVAPRISRRARRQRDGDPAMVPNNRRASEVIAGVQKLVVEVEDQDRAPALLDRGHGVQARAGHVSNGEERWLRGQGRRTGTRLSCWGLRQGEPPSRPEELPTSASSSTATTCRARTTSCDRAASSFRNRLSSRASAGGRCSRTTRETASPSSRVRRERPSSGT